jgi:7,8-dihydropterin-6-yl-methyl-4-(beta-D-ribofuranosyl)aminobenzene 5'-phosphate synthase
MRIVVLAENTASSDEYGAEHGLSLYIETKKHRLLFDTGASGLFAENAEKLGVELAGVDAVSYRTGITTTAAV